ncbi:hypothetical protein ACFV0Y_16570 [Streptomyces sp. NPDC059569]|uniref:hypothetical protein n=1 Tax=Streptomyces sp. NPDC059569 TaxID=3346869 RepID=UPI0036AF3BA5
MNESAECLICHRGLYADELGRYACRPCTDRIDGQLRSLAGPDGLYARLSVQLAPGAGNGGPTVSGSRTAPVPLRLEVLNLMTVGGPVLGPLETWVRDWREHGRSEVRDGGTLQQRVDHAVRTLRFNLEWAAANHPAIDEFAREIGQMARQCEGQVTGEKPPRRIPVACPCGQVLRVALDTAGERCPNCGEQYGHAEVLRLPMAERRVAA